MIKIKILTLDSENMLLYFRNLLYYYRPLLM
jgi:hypothetical protein